MANKSQIKTDFILTGVEKCIGLIRNFSQAADQGLKKAAATSNSLQLGILASGVAAQKSGAVMQASFKAVVASLNAIKQTVLTVFGILTVAVTRFGSIVHGIFIKAAADSKTWLDKVAVGQVAALTGGGGLLFKLNLAPGTGQRLLGIFRGLADQVGGLFSRALSLANPLSRRGIFGIVRRLASASRFAAVPAAGALGTVYKGAADINASRADSVEAGDAVPSRKYSELDEQFRRFSGSGADAAEVVKKFDEALKDIQQNGLSSKFYQSFDDAGLAADVLEGRLTDGYSAYQRFVGKFGDGFVSEDGVKRMQNSAIAIVGNTKALIPFAQLLERAGKDGGLEGLNAELDRFGTYIGPQQEQAASKFANGLSTVKEALRGIAITLTTTVGPALGAWMTAIGNLIADRRTDIVAYMARFIANVTTFATEVMFVITGLDKEMRSLGGGGYQFKFAWLITARDWAVSFGQALAGLMPYIERIGGALADIAVSLIERFTGVGGKVGSAFAIISEWIIRLIENIALLSIGLQLEPDFGWLQKFANGIAIVWGWLGKAYTAAYDFNKALKDDPRIKGFYKAIAEAVKDAAYWTVELVNNVKSLNNSGNVSAGFEWLKPVGATLSLIVAGLKLAGNAWADFLGVISGNSDALAANPALAAFKTSLTDDFWPALKQFVGNAVDFATALLPPVFATMNAIFEVLKPKIDSIGGALKGAGQQVVGIVKALSQVFSGEAISDDKFKWVKTVTDDVKILVDGFIDLVKWVGKAAEAFSFRSQNKDADLSKQLNSDGTRKFDDFIVVIDRVVSVVKKLVGWIADIGTTIGSLVGPANLASTVLAAMFGGVVLSSIASMYSKLTLIKGLLGSIGKMLPGALGKVGGAIGGFALSSALGGGFMTDLFIGGLSAAAGSAGVKAAFARLFGAGAKAATTEVAADAAAIAGNALKNRAAQTGGGLAGEALGVGAHLAGGAAPGLAQAARTGSKSAAGTVADALSRGGGAVRAEAAVVAEVAGEGGLLNLLKNLVPAGLTAFRVSLIGVGITLGLLALHLTGADEVIATWFSKLQKKAQEWDDANTGVGKRIDAAKSAISDYFTSDQDKMKQKIQEGNEEYWAKRNAEDAERHELYKNHKSPYGEGGDFSLPAPANFNPAYNGTDPYTWKTFDRSAGLNGLDVMNSDNMERLSSGSVRPGELTLNKSSGSEQAAIASKTPVIIQMTDGSGEEYPLEATDDVARRIAQRRRSNSSSNFIPLPLQPAVEF